MSFIDLLPLTGSHSLSKAEDWGQSLLKDCCSKELINHLCHHPYFTDRETETKMVERMAKLVIVHNTSNSSPGLIITFFTNKELGFEQVSWILCPLSYYGTMELHV